MDLSTNTDLLPLMIYARQYGEWDYKNVHVMLLRHKVGRADKARGAVGSQLVVGARLHQTRPPFGGKNSIAPSRARAGSAGSLRPSSHS